MKPSNVLLIGLMLLFCSCPADQTTTTENKESVTAPEQWSYLLQGELSDHWEMYNQGPIKGWELKDGQLHASGAGWDQNEDLITKKEYDNFELYLEWKVSPENSSGIFYHVQVVEGKPIYESAPEYQIMDDLGWPQEMKPNQYTAGSYAMYAPEGGSLKPVGQWNSSKILVDYPHVEHWLNGVRVVAFEIGSEDWQTRKAADKWAEVPEYGQARSGHIGLQNAGRVVFREIKIRDL